VSIILSILRLELVFSLMREVVVSAFKFGPLFGACQFRISITSSQPQSSPKRATQLPIQGI
jgi:hypothetical protein